MGSQGTDVVLSEAAYKLFPFSVEAKNQEVNKTFLKMWEQATENSQNNDGMLVLSANNSPVLAVVELDYLMRVLSERSKT